MITLEEVRNLSNVQSKEHMISSLYLRLWPDQRIHQTKVKDLIRGKLDEFGRESHPLEERQWVEKDLKKMQEFVGSIRGSPRKGVVIFSCSAHEVWEVFFLSRPVRDLLILDFSAYIRPLAAILDQYRRVCTLLVDRTRARIFEVFMGEIEEQTEIFSDVPSKVREAGWYGLTERRIERHIQMVRTRFWKFPSFLEVGRTHFQYAKGSYVQSQTLLCKRPVSRRASSLAWHFRPGDADV